MSDLPAGPRIGSVCTGYGGLDLAVELVLGGRLAWYAETDRHARTVLAARWPGVPNLGDIRTVNWAGVERTKTFLGQLGTSRRAERTRLQADYDRALRVIDEIDSADRPTVEEPAS